MAGLNRIYYPQKYPSRAEVVAHGIKCIFISHQRKDKEEAKKVADYIQNAGIDIYFDEYDKDLKVHHQSGDPKGITKAICNGINNSSHMMVVVSPNTVYSTWVPFEIGYGYDKTDLSVLCLKGIPKGGLPEYVRTALIVRDIYDLNRYIKDISGGKASNLIDSISLSDFSSSYNPLLNVMDILIQDKY
jgi:hypothetical protein